MFGRETHQIIITVMLYLASESFITHYQREFLRILVDIERFYKNSVMHVGRQYFTNPGTTVERGRNTPVILCFDKHHAPPFERRRETDYFGLPIKLVGSICILEKANSIQFLGIFF